MILSMALVLVVTVAGAGAWLTYANLRRTPPGVYQQMEHTIADMNRQMSEFREQQAADHEAMRQLRAELRQLDMRLGTWQEYARTLGAMFREATGQEPPPEPEDAPPPVARPTVGKPVQLAALIVKSFSMEEMTGLAFELGIEGDVTGATTKARAQSLVGQANRRGLMERLITLCREQRPEGGF